MNGEVKLQLSVTKSEDKCCRDNFFSSVATALTSFATHTRNNQDIKFVMVIGLSGVQFGLICNHTGDNKQTDLFIIKFVKE